jgi:hypothetical protein
MIITEKFTFPKIEYFKILLQNTIKKCWWVLAILIVMIAYGAIKESSQVTILLSILPLIYILYLVIRCWLHACSKKNKLFYQERYFEVNNHSIICHFNEGTTNEIKLCKIARVIKNPKYYRLFLSKKHFIYIPLAVFRSINDINEFDSFLKARLSSIK